MTPLRFRYHVSMRITHPEIEPDEITQALSLTPTSVGFKGDPVRLTTQVRTTHRWYHIFNQVPDDEPLTSRMRSAIVRLQERRQFIERVYNTGGRVQFAVYLYPPGGRDQPFDYSLITDLRELGIGFQITMYSGADYERDSSNVADASLA